MKSLSLEVFKTQLDKNLTQLVWIQYQPSFEQQDELEASESPFQPDWLYHNIFFTFKTRFMLKYSVFLIEQYIHIQR